MSAASSVKPILWNYFRSSASWRVRIALELKQIDYEYKLIDLGVGEQNEDHVTKLNNRNEVPILQIDGQTLTQSLPLIEYLDETRPSSGPSLLPKDPVLRQKARAIAEMVNSGIQPFQNTNVNKRVADYAGDEKRTEWIQFYLHKGFRGLEAVLAETSGKYCVGDELTIADCALVPQIYSGVVRFDIDMEAYPNVARVYAELEKHEAFRKAHAHRQIDTPDRLREN